MVEVVSGLRAVVDGLMPSSVAAGLAEAEGWSPDEVEAYCARCGASAGPGSTDAGGCVFCRGKPVAWDTTVRLSGYVAPMDGWIKAMKFGRRWSWGPHLGRRLAERVEIPDDGKPVVVCPVPMPWRRRWGRGFNQSALMAEALAAARGWPCVELLRRTRHTPPQTAVPASRRSANIRGSFAVRPIDVTGCRVLLVDDVKTTGATLHACARLLKQAGADEVRVAVAAVADPKDRNFKAL
ncbi:MAG: phosphoribosyltransferase family protein [Planctomycetota bacterium]